MQLTVFQGDFIDTPADLGVVFVSKEGKESHMHVIESDRLLDGFVLKHAKHEGFEGNFGERLILPTFGRMKAKKICLIGVGQKKGIKNDLIRRAGGLLIKVAKEAKAKKVIVSGSVLSSNTQEEVFANCFAEGVLLGAYEFRDHFGSFINAKKTTVLEEVCIVESDKKKFRLIEHGVEQARVLAAATNTARDLVNTSPRHMRPSDLAHAASKLVAKGNGIACRLIHREEMERLGMGAALAVAEGSQHAPVCVHLVYRPKKKAKKKVAVIGKAVTFDSGGLSLKSADAMANMKIDMAGASSIIGLFQALPSLDLKTEVHGVFIAVENMPSGTSYRPGDVVKAMNGMTIEILNTDAEGRVTMADAVSYAVKKIKPDEILDIATLTGASIIALGDDCAAFMTNQKDISKALSKAAKRAGELLWELPLIAHYDEAMHSKVADMNNTGGRSAGCIKGGLFIQRFVNGIPWAHIDIAGPSFCEKEYRPDIPYGGTGFGVRTLAEYLKDRI